MYPHLLDAWRIHQQKNIFTLKLSNDHLSATSRPRARSIAKQFQHMHNVRVQWLAHIKPLQEAEKTDEVTFDGLLEALNSSSNAIENIIRLKGEGHKVTGVRKNLVVFIGYLISHESHHRGQILLTLKLNRVSIDQQSQYALWEWK